MGVTDGLAARFREIYDADPAGVWSAPGRVNLIGEHTDYNQGLCLPIALPQRTYAAVSPRDDDLVRMWSAQSPSGEVVEVDLVDVEPGTPGGWAAYAAGVVWALRQAGYDVRGVDLALDGRVPVGSGLSSSAALECAVAVACSDLFDLHLAGDDRSRAVLADICVSAENDIAMAPTGGMDQAASLRCTPGHALLLDCRDGNIAQVPFDLAGHGLALLVMDTRAEHALVDGQYAARRAACEAAAAALGVPSLREIHSDGLDDALAALPDEATRRRTRHVVTEIARVRQVVDLLGREDFAGVGALFDASHASLRDDFEVSCTELDLATATAREHGALGARMTGGGFGGSAIALLPVDTVETVTAAVEAAFHQGGFARPVCFAVTAGPSASKET